jgi:hypothetical protein
MKTELIVLNAAIRVQETRDGFLNRHLVEMTGISKQNIYKYLKKWEKNGYAVRNPLNPTEWILTRKDDLLESLITGSEPASVEHMLALRIFNEDYIKNTIHKFTDTYAALCF